MSKTKKIIFAFIFTLCFFIQILPVFRSGLEYSYGIGFWGSNGHDAVWHLSLINHLNNPLKIELPIFAGETLKNYHPFFDILIALFSNLTHISSSLWYFQIFPIISTSILLYFAFLIGRRLTSKFSGGLLLMFFTAFANSFGWLVTLFRTGQIGGESLFWSMQSASNQLNPPYVLSLIFIETLIVLITDKKIRPTNKNILIFLILILTPITKAYGGVVIYLIYFFYSLSNFKKTKQPLILFLISLPVAFILFSIYNSASGTLFVFKPFWFINSLIESPDRFYLPFLANMRYALENSGRLGPRLILIYLFSVIVFYLGNFSWRFIAFFSLHKIKQNLKYPLLATIIITAIVPLFFIQKGTSWNTIQFLYYSLFLSNIFLTIFLVNQKSKTFSKILILIIIITTLISNFETINRYLSNPAPATLTQAEIQALNFLKNQKQGIVLTYPYNQFQKKSLTAPIPLYAYETTAYVSAFSQQSVYLEDEMNLNITNYDWKNRLTQEEKFFTSTDKFFARGFLINNNIQYIYLVNNQQLPLSQPDIQVNLIFNNSQVRIYQVQR